MRIVLSKIIKIADRLIPNHQKQMEAYPQAEDFSAAYAGFAGEFLTMLVFAASLFNANESISHDEMIIAIYLFHRKISHNTSLRKKLSEVFTDNLLSVLLCALGDIK